MSEKLDVAEARALLRFHEAEHQLQLYICIRTSTVNTISPPPSLVIHNFIVRYKAFPQTIFTRRAIPFLPSRLLFVSNRRAKTATSPGPAHLPAHDILSRTRGAAKHHQICKIHPELLKYRSNRHKKLCFNNHLVSAPRESQIKEHQSARIQQTWDKPSTPQFAA